MGEPTDEVVLEGGPFDGVVYAAERERLLVPGWLSRDELVDRINWQKARGLLWMGLVPENTSDTSCPTVHTYADTGRRTADGRRVFAAVGETPPPAGSHAGGR